MSHVVKLARDPGVVMPDSNEARTHVLVAGRLDVDHRPQHWAATAFYRSTAESGAGFRHAAVPFRPEEFPPDLFRPEYMGKGVHSNVDYHAKSVDGEWIPSALPKA